MPALDSYAVNVWAEALDKRSETDVGTLTIISHAVFVSATGVITHASPHHHPFITRSSHADFVSATGVCGRLTSARGTATRRHVVRSSAHDSSRPVRSAFRRDRARCR